MTNQTRPLPMPSNESAAERARRERAVAPTVRDLRMPTVIAIAPNQPHAKDSEASRTLVEEQFCTPSAATDKGQSVLEQYLF